MSTPLSNKTPSTGNPSDSAMNNAASPVKMPHSKFGTILDQDDGGFCLEYDDTTGKKNEMRLYAETYEGAIREARSYLGIQDDGLDEDGDSWTVE